jgi:hypothetical protein
MELYSGHSDHFCNLHNIFNGSWTYGDIIHVPSNPYQHCPLTLQSLSQTTLKDQPNKWSCLNSSYYSARYSPYSCEIRSLSHSLKLLSNHHLTFIGDSLMGEMYIALSCAIEQHNRPPPSPPLHSPYSPIRHPPPQSLTLQFIHELFLRPDFPCHPKCLTNFTFREEQKHSGLIHQCFQCSNGTQTFFNQSYLHNPKYWPSKVKNSNTTSVLLSVGAWYNYFHHIYQPLVVYTQTLQKNLPIIHQLKFHHGILFYWLDVPPMPSCSEEWCQLFGWDLYEKFNFIAKKILEPAGVIFLNTSQFTRARKEFDSNITDLFHLHWCNPGDDTVPVMLMEMYLHLLTHHLGL